MNILDEFIGMLCGEFNNDKQIENQQKNNKKVHPKAKHINGIANKKIINLPDDFSGYFVIEESYYIKDGRENILPHLFLFQLDNNNQVVLKSFEIPKDIPKEKFTNDNSNIKLDYNKLEMSKKFNFMTYIYNNGVFEGESISDFSKDLRFELKEKIEQDKMYVSEVFYKNSKITFGFVEPIIYNRVK